MPAGEAWVTRVVVTTPRKEDWVRLRKRLWIEYVRKKKWKQKKRKEKHVESLNLCDETARTHVHIIHIELFKLICRGSY